ncbi:MAG: MerR family transcriptional regulator [Betaproteobacteria bacterium]|nr:MerR family transcriptional regulator [Betaproteobacteria bacterium]
MEEHNQTPPSPTDPDEGVDPQGHASRFSLADLASASGVPERTIRFYIQQGLVPRPEGSKRGSYYEARHLEALLTTARLVASGLSLAAIARMLEGGLEEGFRERKVVGQVETLTQVHLAAGIRLHIDPLAAGLSPEQLRKLVRKALQAIEAVKASKS